MNLVKNEVRYDDAGFIVERTQGTAIQVHWEHVREIFGFKREPHSVDQVCLGIRLDDSMYFFWVGEDDRGGHAFFTEVEKRFGVSSDWYRAIVDPPLQENRKTLWRRE